MLVNEKLDSKGLRTHCPHCEGKLYKRKDSRGHGKARGETCSKCDTYVHYDPMELAMHKNPSWE